MNSLRRSFVFVILFLFLAQAASATEVSLAPVVHPELSTPYYATTQYISPVTYDNEVHVIGVYEPVYAIPLDVRC